MANTLPEGGENLVNGVTVVEQPTLTWYVDPDTRRILRMDEGLPAMTQAVEIMLRIARYRWQIYGPNFGSELDGLIGLDEGYVAAELLRRVKDALSIDARVHEVRDYKYQFADSVLTATFTVVTVFGEIPKTVEVTLSD